jgi:sensor domain CHASE-containing protein
MAAVFAILIITIVTVLVAGLLSRRGAAERAGVERERAAIASTLSAQQRR